MSFFSRLIVLWSGFWNSLLGKAEAKNQNLVNEGLIQKQRQQLHRLKEALIQLIFQQKRISAKVAALENEKRQLQEDLHQAALDDRDELALHLIERMDCITEEETFLKDQALKVSEDIGAARKTEKELAASIDKNRQQLTVLTYRRQTLVTRNEIRRQLDVSASAITDSSAPFSQIQEQIHRLEVENEILAKEDNPFDNDLKEMRRQRQSTAKHTRLLALKSELKGRLLPAPKPLSFQA